MQMPTATPKTVTIITLCHIPQIILFLVLILLPSIALTQTLEDRVSTISNELMCPVCQGQSVGESNSQLANDMRNIIRKMLVEGKSEHEIIAYFVDKYGESILAAPPTRGVNWFLWIMPGLAVVLGAVVIAYYLYGTTGPAESTTSNGDRDKTESNKYLDRIEDELNKFES